MVVMCRLGDHLDFYLSELVRKDKYWVELEVERFIWTYSLWSLRMEVTFGHDHESSLVRSISLRSCHWLGKFFI